MPDIQDAVGFPQRSHYSSEVGGAVEASTTGTTVTSGAANTKGSWTQLIASTAADSAGILLMGFYPGVRFGIDVGIGAAGSETVIVPNIFWGQPGNRFPLQTYVPVSIKAGTRIAVRAQDSSGGQTVPMLVAIFKAHHSGQTFPLRDYPTVASFLGESAGYLTATSVGTTITASGTTHVKGSWAQLIASTTKRTTAVVICMGAASGTDVRYFIDVGTGGAGSEVVLIPDIVGEFSNPFS